MYMERYDRQIMLPEIGTQGQQRLQDATVLIVGLGGLGSVVSTYLTGAGIGHLILADNDRVSLTNLQRQVLYTESEVGQLKTECAVHRLSSQSSDIVFESCPDGFTADNARMLVSGCDIVVDCTDNYATRYLIDDTCAECAKPWVYGSIGAFFGQASLFNHKSGRRYVDLYPDREALCSLPRRIIGVLGTVPATIGAIEAMEVIKYVAGFGDLLDGKLFSINFLTLQNNIVDF